MGKRCFYDLDVQKTFGLEVAVYFEVLRFRQQLHRDEFFKYRVKDITSNCGLSYKQQLRSKEALEIKGWIETRRDNGCSSFFITEIARTAIKYTPRRQNMKLLQQNKQKLVNKKT